MFSTDALLDALPIGICGRDRNERIVYVNAAMSELLCLPRELLLRRSLHEVLVEEQSSAIPASLQGDVGLFRAAAARRRILMESRRVYSSKGRLDFIAGFVCDPFTPLEALERAGSAPDDPRWAREALAVRLQEHLVSSGVPSLSPRQLEIVQLASLGYASREIASLLQVTVQTVRYHSQAAFKKLRIRSRLELVRLFVAAQRMLWRVGTEPRSRALQTARQGHQARVVDAFE